MERTTLRGAGSWSPLFIVVVATATLAFSQSATGRVVGTVTDPLGAVIDGARVTVTNTRTGARSETTSGRDGRYQVLEVLIGIYTVMVQQAGFETAVTPPTELQINQTLRVDVAWKSERSAKRWL